MTFHLNRVGPIANCNNGSERVRLAVSQLARTLRAQMEALRKHRTWRMQTVTVRHVNVHHGGAIALARCDL